MGGNDGLSIAGSFTKRDELQKEEGPTKDLCALEGLAGLHLEGDVGDDTEGKGDAQQNKDGLPHDRGGESKRGDDL